MAFSIDGLQQVGPGGAGPRIWVYATADDAIADMNTSGYFNGASDLLGVRDVIFASDTATPTTNMVIVLSNAAGVVDVSNGTAIAETDSD